MAYLIFSVFSMMNLTDFMEIARCKLSKKFKSSHLSFYLRSPQHQLLIFEKCLATTLIKRVLSLG